MSQIWKKPSVEVGRSYPEYLYEPKTVQVQTPQREVSPKALSALASARVVQSQTETPRFGDVVVEDLRFKKLSQCPIYMRSPYLPNTRVP
jgi:hypothetical protein